MPASKSCCFYAPISQTKSWLRALLNKRREKNFNFLRVERRWLATFGQLEALSSGVFYKNSFSNYKSSRRIETFWQ